MKLMEEPFRETRGVKHKQETQDPNTEQQTADVCHVLELTKPFITEIFGTQ